ncbi:hypothetical protein JEZ13_05565 [bacterium]|nr:hypothetical protein [bacterium]
MKHKILLFIILLSLTSSLFAQYDEKKILLKNASDFMKVRKLDLAEELYLEAISKFPQDIEVVRAILEYYLNTNKSTQGNNILSQYSKILTKSENINYEISFLLIDKKNELALTKASRYLSTNKSLDGYRNIGMIFKKYRAYSEAIDIYLEAIEPYPKEFTFDLADSYYFNRDFENALRYYLLSLEDSVGNANLINSRIRNIILQSPTSISVLINHFGDDSSKIEITKENKTIMDVYVDALLNTDKSHIALSILDNYQAKDIYTKAEQFKREKKYNISKLLYELTLKKVEDRAFYYRYTLNFANMLFESGEYSKVDSLITIILDKDDQRYKRNIMFDTYLLKSEIINRNKNLSNQYEFFLDKAEEYAMNNNQKKIVKAKLSFYKILQKDFSQAKEILDNLASFGYDDNFYFNYYLYELLQNGTKADSLATELIIFSPESNYTLDMLELKYILKVLDQNNKKLFLDAYRFEKLYLIEEADSLYSELYQSTKNEYFIIKNALININSNNKERAGNLLSKNFEDQFCHDFAKMQLVFLEDENSEMAKNMARNFLTQYPNSSFAAQVRQILMINQNE